MIAIPNIDKPKDCQACPIFLWCYTANDWKGYEHCPLIDIVRCGECKHWYNDADCGMACEFTNMKQPSDGFCNWGERRSE